MNAHVEAVELIETDHAVNIDSVSVKGGGYVEAQILPTDEPTLKVAREVATRCEVTLTAYTTDNRVRFRV
jgi:hypothetical protein